MAAVMEVKWESYPMNVGGQMADLDVYMVLEDVAAGEFVCRGCDRGLRAQKTVVLEGRMNGKVRRQGAYCVKCGHRLLQDKVEKKEGGPELMALLERLAVGAALSDEEVFLVIEK